MNTQNVKLLKNPKKLRKPWLSSVLTEICKFIPDIPPVLRPTLIERFSIWYLDYSFSLLILFSPRHFPVQQSFGGHAPFYVNEVETFQNLELVHLYKQLDAALV